MADNNRPQESSGNKPEQIPLWLDFVFFLIKFLVLSAVLIGALIISVYVVPIVAGILLTIWFIYTSTVGSKRR